MTSRHKPAPDASTLKDDVLPLRDGAHRAFCASETFFRAAADQVRRGPLAPPRVEVLFVPASGAKAAIAWFNRSRSC